MVNGIVHDRSSSGQTIFVEPTISISIENSIAHELINKRNEIKRIITDLTGEVARCSDNIFNTYNKMIDFDFHNTIAKLALKTNARRPEILDKIEISRGTNPIFIFQKKDIYQLISA